MANFRLKGSGMPTTRYVPPAYPLDVGTQTVNLGVGGPRTNIESQGRDLRVWPTIYRVMARGLGAMPLYQLGVTPVVFNNQFASGYMAGYNVMIPGMGKLPFGD